jgi:hypothetical protein
VQAFLDAAAFAATRYKDKPNVCIVYERWDPYNKMMNPDKIRGAEGVKLDGPTFEIYKHHDFGNGNKYGAGQPVYQYIGRAKSPRRYVCRIGEHNRLRKNVKGNHFGNFVFEFPVPPDGLGFKPDLIPYAGVDPSPILTAAEQLRIERVGGLSGGMSPKNLQNSINAVAGFEFEKWKEQNPVKYKFLKKTCGWLDF